MTNGKNLIKSLPPAYKEYVYDIEKIINPVIIKQNLDSIPPSPPIFSSQSHTSWKLQYFILLDLSMIALNTNIFTSFNDAFKEIKERDIYDYFKNPINNPNDRLFLVIDYIKNNNINLISFYSDRQERKKILNEIDSKLFPVGSPGIR